MCISGAICNWKTEGDFANRPDFPKIERAMQWIAEVNCKDDDKHRCNNWTQMSQNQIRRHMRWKTEWKLTTQKSQYNAEYITEGNAQGCTKPFKE